MTLRTFVLVVGAALAAALLLVVVGLLAGWSTLTLP
jgi:hypothetical protein